MRFIPLNQYLQATSVINDVKIEARIWIVIFFFFFSKLHILSTKYKISLKNNLFRYLPQYFFLIHRFHKKLLSNLCNIDIELCVECRKLPFFVVTMVHNFEKYFGLKPLITHDTIL